MPGHKFYKALPLVLNYSVENYYVIMCTQGQWTDLDRSRTSQQRCLLLNYVPPGVLGKAYCLFNLNAFFSSHLFCWSNTLRCTTAQTLLLTARNKERILFICVSTFTLKDIWKITKCSFSSWKTLDRDIQASFWTVSGISKAQVLTVLF